MPENIVHLRGLLRRYMSLRLCKYTALCLRGDGADAKLTTDDQSSWWAFDKDDPIDYKYGCESMHRLLYMMSNSHVMNGAMPGSVYVSGSAGGLQTVDMVRIGITAVSVLMLALIGLSFWLGARKRARKKATS